MLELGKAGTTGTEKRVHPVFRDGSVVATLRASDWKEAATAVVSDCEWLTHRFVSGRRQVAESGSVGGWAPRPTLTTGPDLPLDHQVLLLWRLLVISRRNTAAVSAATTAGAVGGSS